MLAHRGLKTQLCCSRTCRAALFSVQHNDSEAEHNALTQSVLAGRLEAAELRDGLRKMGLGVGKEVIALRDTLLPISKLLVNLKKSPVAMRMEPGRFVVADAGVLITQVTQIRKKAGRVFVGVATGMNSLIRPALYQAKHAIHNLSKLLEDTEGEDMLCDVVGPICESADVLGHGRMLPSTTTPGDVILIEHGGAYGHCMSSNYNLRVPAIEVTMDSSK